MDRSYLDRTVFRPPVTRSVFLEDLVKSPGQMEYNIPPVSPGCGLGTRPSLTSLQEVS